MIIVLHKRFPEIWPSLCESEVPSSAIVQQSHRDWIIQFNPATNRAHLLLTKCAEVELSSVDIKGNEVDNTVPLTHVQIRWNEGEKTYAQSVDVLASLNVSVGNCYSEVSLFY